MILDCFKESYCTLYGCRCSEGKHGTLFSQYKRTVSEGQYRSECCVVKFFRGTNSIGRMGTLSVIPHAILFLSDPGHMSKFWYNTIENRTAPYYTQYENNRLMLTSHCIECVPSIYCRKIKEALTSLYNICA